MPDPTTITAKLDRAKAEAIRSSMSSGGWEFDEPAPDHALWAARLPTVRAVMYASGKLVLQGKDAAKQFLKENPKIAAKIEKDLRAKLMPPKPAPAKAANE